MDNTSNSPSQEQDDDGGQKRVEMPMQDALELILQALQCDQVAGAGVLLAEITEHGSVCGYLKINAKDERKRYFVAIATNDAADHLDKWAQDQTAMRRKAIQELADQLGDCKALIVTGNEDRSGTKTDVISPRNSPRDRT